MEIKMKPFPCIESTIDISYEDLMIRLWIDVPSKTIPVGPLANIELATQVRKKLTTKPTHVELIEWLSLIPNINAIQILLWYDGMRLGTVVYTVPFEGDVHG